MTCKLLWLAIIIAKFFEHLIKQSLNKEVDERRVLAPNYYRFRQGKGTIQAVEHVLDTAINVE